MARLGGQWNVDRNIVRGREERIEGGELALQAAEGLLGDRYDVIAHDGHSEPTRDLSDPPPDPSQAYDSENFALQLRAGERVLGPPARLDRRVGEHELPREGEHQQDDVLRHGLDKRLGAVHHRYPLGLGSPDVYVVEPRPRSGDKTEPRSLFDHLPVNPRPAPDHKPVVA